MTHILLQDRSVFETTQWTCDIEDLLQQALPGIIQVLKPSLESGLDFRLNCVMAA